MPFQADHIVRQHYRVQRIVPAPLETRGVVAQYQAQPDVLTVWNTTQAPHRVKHLLAELLSRKPEVLIRNLSADSYRANSKARTWALEKSYVHF